MLDGQLKLPILPGGQRRETNERYTPTRGRRPISRPIREILVSRSEVRMMLTLSAIIVGVLAATTIAMRTEYLPVSLLFGAVAVTFLVGLGLVISRDT